MADIALGLIVVSQWKISGLSAEIFPVLANAAADPMSIMSLLIHRR